MAGAARSIHAVTIGTAGHIDHGKSSLVRALTGVDPDRLKEEQERGLTIDLGFAPLQLDDGRTVGMVDVPGHERLVRTMVAGSTALDLALLVVAADDGVMPQTTEHIDILDLLGVSRGIVALSKVDLVDSEIAELAETEIRELIAPTALAGAPIVRVSSTTGQGLDELRAAIAAAAADLAPRPHHGAFRMPVQRVFRLGGIGTVVTGIPWSGSIEPGATVEFLPCGHISKVRAVQAFGGRVERAVAGHSTALSVPDARAAGLRRGTVAALPGVFQIGDTVDVELLLLPRAARIEHRRAVRFHAGTAEVQGRLLLLESNELRGGERTVARIALDEVVAVAPGDRFLLRLQNPVITIGGGSVLRLRRTTRRYRRSQVGEELYRLRAAGSDPHERVLEELAMAGPLGLTSAELAAALAVDASTIQGVIDANPSVHIHQRAGRAFYRDAIERGRTAVALAVERMLRQRPLAASIQRSALRPSRDLPPALLAALMDLLQEEGAVRAGLHGRVLFTERLRPLEPAQQRALDRVVSACAAKGYRPPAMAELAAELELAAGEVEGLVARAVDEGLLEQIGERIYAVATIHSALRAVWANCLAHGGELEIPSLRDQLGTSRKFLIPLLEHIDGLGLTRLRAGVRHLLPSSAIAQELAAAAGG